MKEKKKKTIKFEIQGHDFIGKKVTISGNSGAVIVPKAWIGRKAICILVDDDYQFGFHSADKLIKEG